MRHHLYVCPRDSAELKRHVAFRDHLRSHPEKVKEYGELKRRLALECGSDRERYWQQKSEFVLGILREAMK